MLRIHRLSLNTVQAVDQALILVAVPMLGFYAAALLTAAVYFSLFIFHICIPVPFTHYSFSLFNRRALLTTDTELKDMASPPKIGFSKGPPKAYNNPAAMGSPKLL